MSRRSSESTSACTARWSDTSSFTGPRLPTAWQSTPAPVRAWTTAAPMPLPPPVTTATLPASDSGTEEHLDVVNRPLGQRGKRRRAVLERHDITHGADARPPRAEPIERLPEVQVRVSEYTFDRVVAANDPVPWQRRLVLVQADENRGSGRTQELDRKEPRGAGTHRVDHEVDARLHLAAGRVSTMRAEPAGMVAASGVQLDHIDAAAAVQESGLHAGEPDRAGPDHDGVVDPVWCDAPQRMHSISEGLDERTESHVHPGRQLDQAALGHRDHSREATRHGNSDEEAIGAKVAVSAAAVGAAAAADDGIDGDGLAHP